jgi:hypothetical protein
MNKVRLLMFQVVLIQKIEILLLITSMEESTNNGTLFMPMNGKVNQEKESSTKNLDSMLRDHSL